MLWSLLGLTRLRGPHGFCYIHRMWQDSKGPMTFFCLIFQTYRFPYPRESTSSLRCLPLQCPWRLQGGMGADLALRHNQAGTSLSVPGPGGPLVPSLPSSTQGQGRLQGSGRAVGGGGQSGKSPRAGLYRCLAGLVLAFCLGLKSLTNLFGALSEG